jgi:magnesium-transporting ATPase (P-type)
MQNLQQRIQAGDQAAEEELTQMMQQIGGEQQQEVLAGAMVSWLSDILPMMGASMLLMLVISLIASAYFLLIALNEKATFQEALVGASRLIIPLFLLSLWIFVRTFMWIPFIGIITGIILGPRFALSPVLLVRDHKGVFESATMSYEKTNGFWGKIFGNMIVAGIVVFVAQMVLGFLIGILGMRIAGFLLPVVQMLVTAFITIFAVKLALTIEQNPQRA